MMDWAEWLRLSADEMAMDGHDGWPNGCREAADEIERLRAELEHERWLRETAEDLKNAIAEQNERLRAENKNLLLANEIDLGEKGPLITERTLLQCEVKRLNEKIERLLDLIDPLVEAADDDWSETVGKPIIQEAVAYLVGDKQ